MNLSSLRDYAALLSLLNKLKASTSQQQPQRHLQPRHLFSRWNSWILRILTEYTGKCSYMSCVKYSPGLKPHALESSPVRMDVTDIELMSAHDREKSPLKCWTSVFLGVNRLTALGQLKDLKTMTVGAKEPAAASANSNSSSAGTSSTVWS